jgi:NRAMP (natural resistance-associated macrophage protein)-like metal ion transporter
MTSPAAGHSPQAKHERVAARAPRKLTGVHVRKTADAALRVDTVNHTPAAAPRRLRPVFWGLLGAGLITGAAGNDPAGIATYSQAGATYQFGLAWILLLTFPLVVAVQMISATLGRTTGRGIAGNLRERYPRWLGYGIVTLLVVANVINMGADLQAMAEAVRLLLPYLPAWAWIVLLGALCTLGQTFLAHLRYMALLKWLALVPLAYLGVLLVGHVPWGLVARGLLQPQLSTQASFWLMVVAMLGTTISPYLFFWQSAQEVEDARADARRHPLLQDPTQSRDTLLRIRVDTLVGMGISNLVGVAILVSAAVTLPRLGIHEVATAAQAAEALRPVAGPLAAALFACGIIGSGVLCVQVLAGSAAYAVAEALGQHAGLVRGASPVRAMLPLVAVATLLGVLASTASFNAIRALVWSGAINAVVAIPLMAALMRMAANTAVTGGVRLGRTWIALGWCATAVMALAAAGWAAAAL